jgi:hypothetical protein
MKRQNKNSKKIASAASMLLLSTAMLGMATYAWFTMNREVSVTNMQVKAKTDQGLLINEVATANDANWDNEATAGQTTTESAIQLHATSTANTTTWYAAYSTKANSAAFASSGQPSGDLAGSYKTLNTSEGYTTAEQTVAAVAGTSAEQNITYIDKGTQGYQNGEGYYVKYKYYLKSNGDAITCGTASAQSIRLKDLQVTGNTNSASLDKALRVAVVAGGKAYIFAPLQDNAQTYYVNADTTATTTLTGEQYINITSIPAVTDAGTEVDVFLYFEGEDPDLKTSNVTNTLDNLTVSFRFALVDNSGTVTDNGVEVSN